MALRVAIVGATGNVGRELFNIMDERNFPADKVHAVASRRSIGRKCSYGDKTVLCEDLEAFDFSQVDLVLMSAGGTISKEWSPKIAAAGAIVVDNSSAWRMDPDVPLVVPEVNGEAVLGYGKKNIIANPNCSTAQLVVALKPLHQAAGIKRVPKKRMVSKTRLARMPKVVRIATREAISRTAITTFSTLVRARKSGFSRV